MIKSLILVAAVVFVAPLWADFEISCFEGDCLKYGWEIKDLDTQAVSQTVCENQDCNTNGWRHIRRDKVLGEVVCLAGGCLSEGFDDIHPATGRARLQSRCLNSGKGEGESCLIRGWNTFHPQGAMVSFSRCSQGDCKSKGWRTDHSNGAVQVIQCKPGGCFRSGWTLTP